MRQKFFLELKIFVGQILQIKKTKKPIKRILEEFPLVYFSQNVLLRFVVTFISNCTKNMAVYIENVSNPLFNS